jgi:uncharacterized protein YhaN
VRIIRLDLLAFGHFTGVRLDLSGATEAIHLIYGANEAGKSTALRALRALFYGIEPRSSDNFLHDHDQLRVGAVVQRSDGTEIDFIRRKGTKNTFLDRAGNPADDASLQSVLNSVNEDLFTSLFGIDHERLVAGGQSMLRGGGDVGESLFAAGFGGVSLHDVLEQLDGEAAALFKPLGQNQPINRACLEYKEAKERVAALSLPSRDYEERAAALGVRQQKRDQVAAELKDLRRETNRLERIARALPLLPMRRTLSEELEQIGQVPSLRENFSEERLSAFVAIENGRAQTKANEEKIVELDARIAALPIPETLLAHAEAIRGLYQRLGSHRKAARDLPALQAELRTLEKDANRLLEDLRLGEPGSSRLSRGSRRKVQTLASQHQALVAKVEDTSASARNLSRELESRREERQKASDLTALREALKEARRHDDLEENLTVQLGALRAAETSAANALKRLGLWNGTLFELAGFTSPTIETIDRFEKSWQSLENAASQTAARIREARYKVTECDREMKELLGAGSVPSEAELLAARGRREQEWRLIRRAWLGQAAGVNDPDSLAVSYEAEVQASDDLADRLRREATRVAQHAHLAAEREHLTRETNDLITESAQQEAALRRLGEEWRALWPPFDPLPPREMRGWVQKQERLITQADELDRYREGVAIAGKRIAQHRAALAAHLPDAGDQALRTLVSQGLRLVEKADILSRDIERLTAESNIAAIAREEAQAAFTAWKEEWREAMLEIGRTETASPEEANDFIADCAALQEKIGEADRLRARIKAIQSDADLFEKEAAVSFTHLTPGRAAPKAEEAIGELYARFNQATQDAATLGALTRQRRDAVASLEEARKTVTAEELRLAAMCREAGCAEVAQLEAVERKSRESKLRRTKLEQLDERLAAESAGAALAEFIAGIEPLDADQVAVEIAQNLRAIGERDELHTSLSTEIGGLDRELRSMDGNARALEAAEDAQSVLARIEEHTERYIRVKLAGAILRREIEEYRAKNQSPLLARAGVFFRQLTIGSFTSISTGFDANDHPVLEGVRSSGQRVIVERMSDGTRDQLFLALRLASVERFIAGREPMPFIVDDVLIGFDHEREAAVFGALRELAKKTQVIVFTHHRHLVDLARRILGGAVRVHDLDIHRMPPDTPP